MSDKQSFLDAIQRMRKWDERDLDIIAHEVKWWEPTKKAGLRPLAFAMCQDGSISKGDTNFLLDELEKFIKDETDTP